MLHLPRSRGLPGTVKLLSEKRLADVKLHLQEGSVVRTPSTIKAYEQIFGSRGGATKVQTALSPFFRATGGCGPIQLPDSLTSEAWGAQKRNVTLRSF